MFVLRLLYKSILAGMPMMLYNPFSNIINSPFTISSGSSYINFRLNELQKTYLENFLTTEHFELIPVKIHPLDDENSFFISVNIYNCSSPLFMNGGKEITRCEINTYVKDKKGDLGTLIMDYSSNEMSIDPVDLFVSKRPLTRFWNRDGRDGGIGKTKWIDCDVSKPEFYFKFSYLLNNKIPNKIDPQLCKMTDNIFYRNGIYDKLFYDSSFIHANISSPRVFKDFTFRFRDLQFDNIHSIFFFENPIHFICSLWHNL